MRGFFAAAVGSLCLVCGMSPAFADPERITDPVEAAQPDPDGEPAETALAEAAPAAEAQPAALRREVFAELGGIEILGSTDNYLEVGLGVFDPLDQYETSETSFGGSIEVRGGDKLWFIGPAVGLVWNADGGLYGYGGAYMDFAVGDFVFTPQAGLGAYREGDSSDLGGVFQFRIGASLNYELENGWRVGFSWAHISNAGINEINPGAEEVYVILSVPF